MNKTANCTCVSVKTRTDFYQEFRSVPPRFTSDRIGIHCSLATSVDLKHMPRSCGNISS
jgi:hypothetical protein